MWDHHRSVLSGQRGLPSTGLAPGRLGLELGSVALQGPRRFCTLAAPHMVLACASTRAGTRDGLHFGKSQHRGRQPGNSGKLETKSRYQLQGGTEECATS